MIFKEKKIFYLDHFSYYNPPKIYDFSILPKYSFDYWKKTIIAANYDTHDRTIL